MKIFPLFLVILFCWISPVKAADAPNLTDCGISQNKIIPGDGTLCNEDIAFGVMYEMFPLIFKEIGPLWNLTSFSTLGNGFEQQDLLGQYHGDTVFLLLYKLFRNLVILCAITYLVFLAVDIGGRMLRGKSLNDDDPGKDNNKSWATGGTIGVIFLLPYKQLFLGPIVIFSFAIASLSTANFVLSLFLSSQESLISASETQDRTNFTNPNIAERHDYIANNMYRYLVGMVLCQRESAAYIMTKAGVSAETSSKYKQWYQCAKGNDNTYRTIGEPREGTAPAFINVYEGFHNSPLAGNVLLSEMTSIEFLSDWRSFPQCGELGLHSSTYYCGSIRVYEPDWGSNPLMDLLPQSMTLINSLESLASSINHNSSPADIENTVYDHWIRFYETIKSELFSSIADLKTDGANLQQTTLAERQRTAAKQALLDQNGHAFRQLARFYHQSAQNILAFGRTTSYRETGYDTDPVNGARAIRVPVKLNGSGQGLSNLFYRMDEAKFLADYIERSQCLDSIRTLFNAKKTLDFIQQETSNLQTDAHARCLDMQSLTIKELEAAEPYLAEELWGDYISQRYTQLETEFMQKWAVSTSRYAAQRRAIEKSFKRYISDYDAGGALAKMRQQGYLAVAGFTYHMTSKMESIKREVKQLTNHFEMNVPGYDKRYLGAGLHETAEQDSNFLAYERGDTVFQLSTLNHKLLDPLVDRYFWLVQQSMLMRQPTLAREGDWAFSRVLDNMTLPITGLSRLGMNIKGDKDWRLCSEDPSKCPFPITDPMLELSLMGHDMVDSGVAFYTLAIGMQGIGSLAAQSQKVDFKGTVTNRSRTSGVKSGGGVLSSLLKDLGGLSQLLFSIMGTILLFYMAIGAVLAYLLPIMPFLFIYMGFITWVMVVVMASFSILLWSFFWIRLREKRDMLMEAGFHYSVDLLFKPTFNLISVLFAWAMFYVLMFVLGMSSGWMTTLPLSGEGAFGVRQMVDPLFILLFIGFIYAMALKFSYNVMDEMSGELLTKLGVKNKSVKDSVGNLIKAMLYDKVMEKGRELNSKFDGSGSAAKEQQRAMENMAKVQAAQQAQRAAPMDRGIG